MSARPQQRLNGDRYYLIIGVIFLGLLGALGGASRADELQQFLIRFAAIIVIAATLWPLRAPSLRDVQAPALAMGLVYLLLFLQLIPLPLGIWARMPGHDLYATVARQTDAMGWRPWTISPDLTLNALAALLPATAIGLVTFTLDSRGRLALARVLVIVACASAVLGLMQLAAGGATLHLFQISSDSSAVGVFANRNHEAVLMACGLPIIAALASIGSRQKGQSLWHVASASFGAFLLLLGLAATGSRMGLLLGSIGSVAAVTIYAVTSRPPSVERNIGRFWVAGAGVVIAGMLPLSLLTVRGGAVARLMSDPVDQTRVAALGPMLAAVRAFMPFGSGFGTFDSVYRRFEPDALLSTIYFNEAHNEPMQLAIEGGLPALILLVLFLGWWVLAVIRTVRSNEPPARRALPMAMAAITLILMVSSLVDYPLRTPLLSGVFAIACVELLRSTRRADAPHPS